MSKKHTIDDMQRLAAAKGGKCLSEEYYNNRVKLKWECGKGHVWEAKPNSITCGTWCPICANKQQILISDMQELAAERGGKCLSEKYINSSTKLLWECNEGHTWFAMPSHIKNGHWCPVCYRKRAGSTQRFSIEYMHKLAEERGGKCLSTEYKNVNTKLKWECSEGHIWDMSATKLTSSDYWCPICDERRQALTIEDMQRMAKERSGKCLSKKYIDSKTKLRFQCADGHIWETQPSNIRGGSWCPYCTKYFNEEKCRYILESIFKKQFNKTRQIIKPYELDGYNEELRLAFEYQGIQHYEYINTFYISYEDFEKRKQIDKQKEDMCIHLGIKLIAIPYYVMDQDEKLIDYINKSLIELGFNNKYDINNILFNGFYDKLSTLNDLHELAKSRGGKCLSKEYLGPKAKMEWQCGEGHTWKATAIAVRHRTWCPVCAKKVPMTIEDIQDLAQSRGGKCLSDTYITNKEKMKWQCKEGHIWEARTDAIKRGSWCPVCASRLQNITDMQLIASSRGGKCLSDKFINSNTKLEWQCKERHTWKSTSATIKSGHWCPTCGRSNTPMMRKLKIEEMKIIAQKKGGKCLSDTYTDAKTKLKWQCDKGHIWDAISIAVKRGAWCPICSGNVRKTIEDMQELANSRGGKCLSNSYTNNKTKLQWECSQGHIWEARPDMIIRGNWCPICSKKHK